MDKEPQKRGLSYAGLPKDEPDGALLFKELESCQGLIDTRIAQEPLNGWIFGEGMVVERKMVKKHGLPPFYAPLAQWIRCLSSALERSARPALRPIR